MSILAIDPGPTESAYVLADEGRRPIEFAKMENAALLMYLRDIKTESKPGSVHRKLTRASIEKVASYGMAVGAEVFDTCIWTGRFAEVIDWWVLPVARTTALVTRQPIKLHHCHDSRAKDSNITQALIDRFAPGEPNRGKGTKANPGWFYGFKDDIWQAYALAVYAADKGL